MCKKEFTSPASHPSITKTGPRSLYSAPLIGFASSASKAGNHQVILTHFLPSPSTCQSSSPRSLTSETVTPLPFCLSIHNAPALLQQDHSDICSLSSMPPSKANLSKICSCLGIPPDDPPPEEPRQNSSMVRRDTLHCLIPIFISCLLSLHSHPELLTPEY